MSKSVRWSIVVGVVIVAAIIASLVSSMSSQFEELCEVCITFRGRTACREAYGGTQEEAIRTATDNACGLIASGMTDSISCSKTVPDRTTCEP